MLCFIIFFSEMGNSIKRGLSGGKTLHSLNAYSRLFTKQVVENR
jgi:hypothetical protein